MLFRHKTIFWLSLSFLLFGFFRWLFGIALPGIAFEFAFGATFILVSGFFTGNVIAKLWIINSRNLHQAILVAVTCLVSGFITIAFLLNAMIEKTTLFPFAITVLILFIVASATGCLFTIIRHQYKTRLVSAQAAMAQSKSELQLLQSQLSPHFLFNTLNNLYGLSMSQPERLPPLLLKLSELLRYSVYDVKEIFVPIEYEIDYLKNYIEFEKLRLGTKLHLTFNISPGFPLTCKIPPLLLIVFVENAFKHSRTTGEEIVYIDLSLIREADGFRFSSRNSIPLRLPDQTVQKRSGFGLNSVRKRLSTLYPGKHTLTIQKSNDDYSVHLKLQC
jgi:LytS/YehU family sensor histidine kinase